MRYLLVTCLLLANGCVVIDYLRDEDTVPRDCDIRLPFYPDQDGDGVGATSPVALACTAPSGYVELSGDCDDDDPSVIECPDTEPPEDTGDTEPPEDTGDDTSDTQPGPLDPMGRRG